MSTQPTIKQDDLQHPALEQLPGLSYCINDNPDIRELPCYPTLPHFISFLGSS
jgi:hypothetical protein